MNDELAQVIEAGTAAIRDPSLNPQEVATKSYHSVATSGPAVHETKKSQAIEIAQRYSELLVGALRRCEFGSIEGLLSKFFNEYRYAGLSTPEGAPARRP